MIKMSGNFQEVKMRLSQKQFNESVTKLSYTQLESCYKLLYLSNKILIGGGNKPNCEKQIITLQKQITHKRPQMLQNKASDQAELLFYSYVSDTTNEQVFPYRKSSVVDAVQNTCSCAMFKMKKNSRTINENTQKNEAQKGLPFIVSPQTQVSMIDNYVIKQQICKGTFGKVFLAEHIDSQNYPGNRVIKEIIMPEDKTQVFVPKEVEYVKNISKISQHPNIVEYNEIIQTTRESLHYY